jgi:glutamate dehydrogenase (NAD(P)+)
VKEFLLLLELPVDILIPAAVSGVITQENAEKVRAKLIAEGANGPLTKGAIEILSQNGTFIIPDILCNAGGVIVSYFEWVQGLQQFFWDLDQINRTLHDILKRSFAGVVYHADNYKVDMKEAAMITSLERLQGAMKLRGMWPG